MGDAVNRWSTSFLDAMRHEADPLADRTVAAVYESGSVDRVNRLLNDMIGHGTAPPEPLPPAVAEYLEQSSHLPPWVNPTQVALGEALFGEYGVGSCAILACASLPECYVMRNGIHVLAKTQRLQQHAQRRVLETAQMIMAVMLKGGLAPGGPGIKAAQKVRLMHASIRFLLGHRPPDDPTPPTSLAGVLLHAEWDVKALGEPICQEDLAFTLMTFSHVAIRSLERLGATLSDEQKDAYVHCWNVVGYVMGIREELLPADHAEAQVLFETIKARQGGVTPEAQAMQTALLAFVSSLLPGGPLKRLPAYLTRQLVGDQTADLLAIPVPPWRDRLVQSMLLGLWRLIDRDLGRLYRDHSALRFGSVWLHDVLMAEIGKLPVGWDKELFNMPSDVLANLPPDWAHGRVKVPSAFTKGILAGL